VTIVDVVLRRDLSLLCGRRRECELPVQLCGGLGEGNGKDWKFPWVNRDCSAAKSEADWWRLSDLITRRQEETVTSGFLVDFGGGACFVRKKLDPGAADFASRLGGRREVRAL